jgi:tetratricopeptide (TPR) repeat protein
MGFKSEAIRYLGQVYLNQKQMGDWARAAETGLELGAALRDDTRFAEAKDLYAEIDEHRRGIREATEVRLVLQLGTIYKNLTQERSGPRVAGPIAKRPVASMHEYQEACRYLDMAIRLAQRGDSPVLLAEALADRAELGILAAEGSPEELRNAKTYLRRLEYVLAYFPIVARMVELCRLRAKILVLEGQIAQAVKLIQQGRALAAENEDSFRVADCDYQLGHLVLHNLASVPTTEFLEMGVVAFSKAESYYMASVSPGNVYLERVRTGHRKLLKHGADLGLTLES